MSLYADYLQERTDDRIIEYDYGFASYRYLNAEQVYIIDIFVAKKNRGQKFASHLADKIAELAKSAGCKEMLGTVVPSTKNSTVSLEVLLRYGMKLKSASDNLIIMAKEI